MIENGEIDRHYKKKTCKGIGSKLLLFFNILRTTNKHISNECMQS